MEKSLLTEAEKIQQQLINHRRWLHQHAETGFDLPETKAYIKSQLEQMGLNTQDCGKIGIIADISGTKPGKTILLRADMDALPIREQTGVPYACPNGNMHACGHDMHAAMLLGAAQLLLSFREEICGTVRLMFQGAEEIIQGAADMIENGVLDNPNVDAAVMIHVMAEEKIPSGILIVPPQGVSAPAADYFTVTVRGKGCHGSTPQKGVDALNTAANILIALQEIVSREVSPSDSTVLTIGSLHAGSAANVIADSAVFKGAVRTFDEDTRSFVKQRIEDISKGICAAFRATCDTAFTSGCPAVFNNESLVRELYPLLTRALSEKCVLNAGDLTGAGNLKPGGGSEDFAYVAQKVPAAVLALSAGMKDKCFPLHHPKVEFDETVLSLGSAAYAACGLNLTKGKIAIAKSEEQGYNER